MSIIALDVTKPGRHGVTFEAVVAAAEQITAGGGKPTLRGIRERLGTGSLGTIQAHLKEWQQGRAPVVTVASTTLPSELQLAVLDEIARQVKVAVEQLEEQLRQVQVERDELVAENSRLDGIVQDLELRLVESERERAGSEMCRDELRNRLGHVEVEVTKIRKEAENARVSEQAAQARLESSARELERLESRFAEDRQSTCRAIEEAAELRGMLKAYQSMTQKPSGKPAKVPAKKAAAAVVEQAQ